MALSSDHELAPAQIEKADFPTAFRGYDQDAVRRYLGRVASAIEHQQKFAALGDLDSTIATQERVDDLEEEALSFKAEISRLQQDLAEQERLNRALSAKTGSDATDIGQLEALDETRIIELLGQETARVLESARSAAADIVRRAETKGADIEREAQDSMIKARREARALVAERKTEADRLVAKVATEAESKARQLTVDAEQHSEAVLAESSKILSEAEAQASAEEEAARLRAAEIVSDAELLRRQVLSELVVERTRISAELEAVNATRDRLTLALSVARGELDVMIGDLDRPLEAQAPDAPDAVDADREVDALIADLEAKRIQPKAKTSSSAMKKGSTKPGSTKPGSGSADAKDDGPTGNGEAPSEGKTHQEKSSASADGGNSDGKDSRDGETASQSKPVIKASKVPGSDRVASKGQSAQNSEKKRTKKADRIAGVSIDDDDGVDTLEFEDESGDQPPSKKFGTADIEANSLIDGFHTIDLTDDDSDENGSGTATAKTPKGGKKRSGEAKAAARTLAIDDHVITTVASRVESPNTDRARGDLLLEEPFSGRVPAEFKARDVALTKYGPNFRRHLRRALNDDQSDVLDRIRAGRGAIKADDLPPIDEQIERYLDPLKVGLGELALAGMRAGGGRRLSEKAIDKLVHQLANYIVEKVRAPTSEVLDNAPDKDREKILEPIRGLYRDFRNSGLTDLADDALYEAFAIGIFGAVDDEAAVSWTVDPRSDPDPICEINAERDDLHKGDLFPSGHCRPLALSNCRCLVLQN